MAGRYPRHQVRSVVNLSGVWDFTFLGDVDVDDVVAAAIDYDDQMAVPGCFDATPKYAGQRGVTAYRRPITLNDAARHRLVLDGVHHWCRVLLVDPATGETQHLRDHAGGFTQFAADIADGVPGEYDLVVFVDNRFSVERSPLHLEYFDWYHFGGIARGGELHRLGELWIDSVRIKATDFRSRSVKVTITWSADATPATVPLRLDVDGQKLIEESIELAGASGVIERELKLKGAALWSPDEPNLHMLTASLGDDDYRQRFGIRQVQVDGTRIVINGQPVQLLGFCRHESHPQFGCGLPEAIHVADVQLLQKMHCNFVRGSHYPQDQRFLDMCDEAGLCVWCESIGWQQTAEHLTNAKFVDAQLDHIDEMVAAAVNHPSVIMWGILNEGHSHEAACRPAYEKLLGRVRQLDSTRPVTYATCHLFEDKCLDLCDVVAVNMYPGWYWRDIPQIPEEFDLVIKHLEKVGHANKPLIISEIGAGAVPGFRDWNKARWSEEYQRDLLAVVLEQIVSQPTRFAGVAIWQFCDVRTSEQVQRAMGRPRGFNNKGVLDEYRRPKLAYEIVKQGFAGPRK